jgi:hypothetical protein
MPYTTYGLLKTLRSHQISSPSVESSVSTGRPNACNLCHLDKTLKWTADALQRMYNIPPPSLSTDEQQIAASLLWLLRGDAGQRAVVAQAMAWPAAQTASGNDWMAPFLAQLFDDSYEALRFIVFRSLRSTPGFERFAVDFSATRQERMAAAERAMNDWNARGRSGDPELLIDATGRVNLDAVNRLVQSRDNRPVYLRE